MVPSRARSRSSRSRRAPSISASYARPYKRELDLTLGVAQARTMDLTGVFVPLVTPFDAAGDVATDALSRLAHELLDDGAAGLVALGTTGEPESLSTGERSVVVDTLAG